MVCFLLLLKLKAVKHPYCDDVTKVNVNTLNLKMLSCPLKQYDISEFLCPCSLTRPPKWRQRAEIFRDGMGTDGLRHQINRLVPNCENTHIYHPPPLANSNLDLLVVAGGGGDDKSGFAEPPHR